MTHISEHILALSEAIEQRVKSQGKWTTKKELAKRRLIARIQERKFKEVD